MEMQSRYIAEVFGGRIQLPSQDLMHTEIERHRKKCLKHKTDPMRVQALSYLDKIASIIGVNPRFYKNRGLLKELVLGPLTASRYRLNGPDSKADEAKQILKGFEVIE